MIPSASAPPTSVQSAASRAHASARPFHIYSRRHPHTRKRTFPRRPRGAAPFITLHRPAASVSRRKGGFFFAQNRPFFFLCRIFDPADFSRPGSPEAIF
jgi:hypothetical protein